MCKITVKLPFKVHGEISRKSLENFNSPLYVILAAEIAAIDMRRHIKSRENRFGISEEEKVEIAIFIAAAHGLSKDDVLYGYWRVYSICLFPDEDALINVNKFY